MISRLRRTSALVRLFVALGAVVAICLLALAIPAWAASSTPSVGSAACGSLQVGVAAVNPGEDTSDATVDPSDNLDATRQCDHTLITDQSRYEAILAGAGLIAFGGATLFYRNRRHHAGVAGA